MTKKKAPFKGKKRKKFYDRQSQDGVYIYFRKWKIGKGDFHFLSFFLSFFLSPSCLIIETEKSGFNFISGEKKLRKNFRNAQNKKAVLVNAVKAA